MGGERLERQASRREGDHARHAVRDDMNRLQLVASVERIRHLPDGIARRAEHDRLHLRAEAAQQIAEIGNAGIDKGDFAGSGGALCGRAGVNDAH
jgi:hypothetical protein